jgi:very-short-patch-repair endonuclease
MHRLAFGDGIVRRPPIVRIVKVETLIANAGPVIHLGSLPEQTRATVRSAYAANRLTRVLPGTYVPTELREDFAARSLAVGWWSPDAVIVGAAAARLTFWPEVSVRDIEIAHDGSPPRGRGYRFSRRVIDSEYIVERHGLRVTAPALTAIDLVAQFGGDAIDICLRSRAARLEDLWAAYAAHPSRPGNAERRAMLMDSRDQPWSAAERLSHRLLRSNGIKGWAANLAIRVEGATYYIDIAFRSARLAIEIDGRLHEEDPAIFEHDRLRQNALVLEGWRVLRFTYRMLVETPEQVVAIIVAALAM